MTFLFNVDGVSHCAAHTDKNRYAIDFSGIGYRRFLLNNSKNTCNNDNKNLFEEEAQLDKSNLL